MAKKQKKNGWDFKNYVLGTMFYRYISENITSYINKGEIEAGSLDFDYAAMSDADAESARDGLVEEKGFFILPSELFCNVQAKAAKGETWLWDTGKEKLLSEKLKEVFRHIEESAMGSESESRFDGLFADFDVNSNKLGATVAKRNEKLTILLNGIAAMNLGDVKHHDIDAFGDAYEYLMTMYASNVGKSGGEFFTPADVTELLTRLGTVGKTEINKVYDGACGTGGMLTVAQERLLTLAKRRGKEVSIHLFGQEVQPESFAMCTADLLLKGDGDQAEHIILFSISNYFLRFANEYKRIHGEESLATGNWYEYVEYGTTNEVMIQLQRYGFSREAALNIREHQDDYVDVMQDKTIKVRWDEIQKCTDPDVQRELEDIHLNTPELFTDYEEVEA